jgi:hypothetical protein
VASSGLEVETTSRKKMIYNYSSSLGKQKKAHRLDYDDTMKSDSFRPPNTSAIEFQFPYFRLPKKRTHQTQKKRK